MKYFVISDIHSNYEALLSFAEIYEGLKKNGDVLICLGDIVGYGPYPSECIQYIHKNASKVISGNHERMLLNESLRSFANENAVSAIEWTDEALSEAEKAYLSHLPERLEFNEKCLMVHGSPVDPDKYILWKADVEEAIESLKKDFLHLCFFGHTHVPGLFDENGGYFYKENSRVILFPEIDYLVNPGSIGQPRDGNPGSSFCVFDPERNTIDFIRYEYNIQKAYDDFVRKGLPEELGRRLFYGR